MSSTLTGESSPDYAEVVTTAHVRYVDLPKGAGRAALITLDNGLDHTKPTTFGPQGLRSLDAALDEVEATGGLAAVLITGKPFIFAVGADLTGVPLVRSREDALEIARAGHAAFRRLGELGIPSVALINGAAMGGGLEVALHCTYRTLSTGAAALSLPEVFLGILPGWGGCYLLPNLIGPGPALSVMIDNALAQNRQLKPTEALRLGIADVLLEPADFITRSMEWVADVLTGRITVTRPELDRGAAWHETVAAARTALDARLHGAAAAGYRALDLVEAAATASRDEAFAAEDEALADLIMSDALRAGLYSFDLVQRRAKRPVGVPDRSLARPVTKAGVVGAGLMASQLALLLAQRLQVPVVMTDLDQERLDRGVARVHAEIDTLQAKGKVSSDKGNRLRGLVTGSVSLDAFADADFIIEAVFEELSVKQQVFAGLERVVSPLAILATNTSSLSVSAMAEGLAHPERVVGFHFFNPVAIMPLVEIARGSATDDATLATAFTVGRELKKSCVLVADRPAFVVNRLLTRFLGEVTAALDEGTPVEVADQALEPLGLPMSPFVLLQLVGPAVALHVSETMATAYPGRFHVSENLQRIVTAGKPGIWSWQSGRQEVDPEVAALLVQGSTPSTADQVRQRALDAMAEEIRLMLDEGVVSSPADIDLCMILGAGWPFHLGGITPYLDRTGTSERVTGSRFLPPGVASLP